MDDFTEIFENQIDSDCSFAVMDGDERKIINCNKIILRAGSAVFKAMFYGSLADSSSTPVEITDYSFKTFETFIKIFYGYTPILKSNQEAFDLYAISDKYNVKHGITISRKYMAHNISTNPGNAELYFKFGTKYDDEVIKMICLKSKHAELDLFFMNSNWAKEKGFFNFFNDSQKVLFGSNTYEAQLMEIFRKQCNEIRQIDAAKHYVGGTLSFMKFLYKEANAIRKCLLKYHDKNNFCHYCITRKRKRNDEQDAIPGKYKAIEYNI